MYGSNGSDSARQLENDRQARIAAGLEQINATFDGTSGVNKATGYTTGQVYYDKYGNPVSYADDPAKTVTSFDRVNHGTRSHELVPGTTAAEKYAADIAAGKLYTGTKKGGGFDDAFYAGRAKDYQDYALPQLNQQAKDTRNKLIYSLARSGIGQSGAAVTQNAALDREVAAQKRGVVDASQASANALRQTVEGQRSSLVSQLEASGDPTASAQLALSSTQAYKQPQTFTPVGQFFEDWTKNYLANQTTKEYDNAAKSAGFSWGTQPSQQIIK